MRMVLLLAATLSMGPAYALGCQPLERTDRLGPLRVTISLSDRAPPLSDAVTVRLAVAAPADVDVELSEPSNPVASHDREDLQISQVRRRGPTADADGNRLWEMWFQV